jgi:uncharacterized protein (TIGR03086 family)
MTDAAFLDLRPQARIVARLAVDLPEDRLADPTPCPGYRIGGLLSHLAGLAIAFRDAARKDLGPTTAAAPDADAVPDLPADWREQLPRALAEMAVAWRDPAAWTGMTRAGGVELPGGVAGAVATDELVIHGWDLARAAGRPYEPDPAALHASYAFLRASAEEDDAGRGEIFGPVVPVSDDAPLLDRAVGLSGRDPRWTPPRTR